MGRRALNGGCCATHLLNDNNICVISKKEKSDEIIKLISIVVPNKTLKKVDFKTEDHIIE